MSHKALPAAHTEELKMDPPVRRRFGRRFRVLWGHGVLAGLPFAEVIVLVAFIASFGMFLTNGDGAPADTKERPAATTDISNGS